MLLILLMYIIIKKITNDDRNLEIEMFFFYLKKKINIIKTS